MVEEKTAEDLWKECTRSHRKIQSFYIKFGAWHDSIGKEQAIRGDIGTKS